MCNLTNLEELDLEDNQFIGSIPLCLCNLTNLEELDLEDNQLTGPILPELGNLINLTELELSENQLTGSIPPELGNLLNLAELDLCGNQLTGSIPMSLTDLTKLISADIHYNALYADDETLRAFLDSVNPGWKNTQTISPEDIATTTLSDTSIEVSWTPIVYTGGSGGYRVYYSTAPGGPYDLYEETQDKTVSSLTVTGLIPGMTHYFYIETVTYPHLENQNTVVSEKSSVVSITLGSCKGDFDNDGDVDGSDLAVFAADFGRTDCSTGDKCEGDFDKDNDVDGFDLAVFAADFGRTDCLE